MAPGHSSSCSVNGVEKPRKCIEIMFPHLGFNFSANNYVSESMFDGSMIDENSSVERKIISLEVDLKGALWVVGAG